LHDEELSDLYSSSRKVRILIFKPKRMRLAWNVSGMKRRKYVRYRKEIQKRETARNTKT
jgi:hypothetical protein